MSFKPLPMQRVSLQLLREDTPGATVALAESGVFNPETVDCPLECLADYPAECYRELYHRANARLVKILGDVACPAPSPLPAPREVQPDELERLDTRLGEIWREFSALEEERRALADKRLSLQQLRESLETFSHLNVDLGLLQGKKSFLSLHLGTIPSGNLERLKRAAPLARHLVQPFHASGDVTYVMVAGPSESVQDISALLKTAEFREVNIPPEFHDYPDQIREDLSTQTIATQRALAETQEALAGLGVRYQAELVAACATLRLCRPYAELARQLRGQGALAVAEGWVPSDRIAALSQTLSERLGRPFVLKSRDPLPAELALVPSVVRHHRLLAPFAALVRNYGVPRYGELDPTLLFAVTFIGMFGMMFGDLGHGAVIALAAIPMTRRFPKVARFLVAAGLSSMLFGVLYGSVFGYEELFHPLWIAPLSDPNLMLLMALYWGIGFIALANLLTIYNLLSAGRLAAALFDNKGGAGLLLYIGGLYAGFRWVGEGVFGRWEGLAILAPLAVILAYKWRTQHSAVGERILVVAVEGFESVMNYMANTLSFLRVAAFSLNHVALAVAVFTLADMMGATGHWITVVLGNVFIIVVEGAIVTIQVLRLEYYEGFSRFFSGDGREFKPLRYGTWGGD